MEVKAVLKSQEKAKFFSIKEELGTRSNSETLRVCISNCYKTMNQEKGS